MNNTETSREYVETEHLSFSYSGDGMIEGRMAIDDVSIKIKKGEFVAVIGRNGSGKSTFAKLVNLLLEPSGGRIYLAGKEIVTDMSDDDILDLRRRVGMVFQNPDNQLIATVVEEDVAFGPENLGLPSEEIRKRVDRSLEIMGMTDFALKEPARLSGGQKQRVAIAGILALMPECIIFDESTAMLDPIGRNDVLDIMKKLSHEFGITVINITHLMNEAAEADRIIVLNKGKFLASGTPREIFQNEKVMSESGIELPQCAKLCKELSLRGIDVGFGITPRETAELIEKYRSEVKR